MKKKYGFIFLGLGIILIILFGVYNFSDKPQNNDKSNNNGTIYKLGRINENSLYFDFENVNNKLVSVSLDKNIYEEVDNPNNSAYFTTIRNKKTNAEMNLSIMFKDTNTSFNDEINRLYNNIDRNIAPTTERVKNKTFFVFDFVEDYLYMYQIDSDAALLIKAKKDKIQIDDFVNILIMDV